MSDVEAIERIVENPVVSALRHGAGAPHIPLNGNSKCAYLTIANPVDEPELIDLNRLFECFCQADAARRTDGSGLGLAVAADLTRAQGGRIETRLDGNLPAFEVTLPDVYHPRIYRFLAASR